MLLVLNELDERCLRDGVGCVAPVSWCVGLGSDMSTGSSEALVEVDECDAFDATEAVWARSAVNSRVSRLTCHTCLALRPASRSKGRTTASCSFSIVSYSSATDNGRGCRSGSAICSLLDMTGLRVNPNDGAGGGGIRVSEGTRAGCGRERSTRGEGGREVMSGAMLRVRCRLSCASYSTTRDALRNVESHSMKATT